MNFYQTRDLIAVSRPMSYDGQEHQPGDRFRPMSQVDADYLVSRGRAAIAPETVESEPVAQTAAPSAEQVADVDFIIDPVHEAEPEAAEPQAAPRRRGRPPGRAKPADE